MIGELAITDGDAYISLKNGAFRLVEWTPVTPPEKSGGVWNDSMLVDNRKPVMFSRGNAIETFQLRVVTNCQDDTIVETQELRRLLEKAKDYWTNTWQNQPVWIVARGSCETNTRYAYIMNYVAERDDDPYQSPFFGGPLATMDEWSLQLERSDWLSHEPGTGACVAASAQQAMSTGTDDDEAAPTASGDDILVTSTAGTVSLVATDHYIGNNGGTIYATGIRFRGVAVPVGANITSARLVVVAAQNDSGGTIRYTAYGDTNTTPAIFSTYADFSARVLTTEKVEYSFTADWTAGTSYTLITNNVDFRAVIQEIVDGVGWASGNDLAVLIFDRGSDDYRRFASFDNVAYTEPILYLEWDTGNVLKGMSATCTDDVYIANKHNDAQLTHAYYYDASAVAWSGNLIGAATPFAMLPAVPAAADILYLCCDTTTLNSGPFTNVIFDIGTPAVDILGVSWQYSQGAGVWANLTGVTSTIDDVGFTYFSISGAGSVSYIVPSAWATDTTGPGAGVTGYWIRAVINAVGAAATAPTQANRDLYTALRPSVDIDEAQVAGDIPALARALVYSRFGGEDIHNIIIATRSQSRGGQFRMFVNLADEQNPVGITVGCDGVNAVFATDPRAPSGRAVRYNPGAGSTGWCTVTFDTSIINAYVGTYRVFLRVYRNSAVTDCTVEMEITINNLFTTHASDTLTVAEPYQAYVMDFGIINLPGFNVVRDAEDMASVVIDLQFANTTATPNLYLYDLIFIPIDEWAGEFESTSMDDYILPVSYDDYNYLDVDSMSQKRNIIANKRGSDGLVYSVWKEITNSPMQLQANADQQVFVLYRYWDTLLGDPYYTAPIEGLGSIQLTAVARYLSMRGNR